jgi:pimeloyl-ACP methyl ester carboxylesterase
MDKPAFVLVHGAWAGAWVWARVLPLLRAAGHAAHAVTLTGCGERAHLRHPGIGLADHIQDVLALVQAEELKRVVLVGHSYGGMVVTGVADRLALHHLVYIDAMLPLPGEAWGSQHAPEVQASRRAAAAAHGNALPPPDPAVFGLADEDSAWLQRRQVPHPFGPYGERLDFDATRLAAVPRSFVDCTAPAYPTIAPMRLRARQTPGMQVHELATGHCPMVSQPQALAALLLQAAA